MTVEEGFEFVVEASGVVEGGETERGHHAGCFELNAVAV